MKRPRPLTVSVIGLGALALGLSLYWVFDVETPTVGEADEARMIDPTYLVADDDEFERPKLPKLAPAKPPVEAGAPPRGLKPPEHIVPEEVPLPEGETRETFELVDRPEEEKKKKGVIQEHRGIAAWDWRAGAPGQTDATATREVELEPGRAWIGSTSRWVNGLANQRGEGTYPGLRFEAPRHERDFEHYWISRFEVSNQDYLRYLQTNAGVIYNTSDFEPRSLVEIARAIILDPPENLDYEDGVAWQLFQANKRQLLDIFEGQIVDDGDGLIDEERTFLKIRDRLVPREVRLSFYDKAPPGHWQSAQYPDNTGGLPVRFLSLEEAIDFAIFDGRFVPNEFQWEFAARGPNGLNYPWGNNPRQLDESVAGGQVFNGDERPRTVNVTNLPNGVSWIGCFNMIGNVAEWTSSFLEPYPGAPNLPLPIAAPILVTRGGSVADEDPLYLRSAFRGWSAESEEGPPRPDFRREWTGLRTARYEPAGESRVPVMHYFARKGRKLDPTLLEPDIFDAIQGLQFEYVVRQFGDDRSRAGVKAFTVQPLQQVGVRLLGDAWHHANTNPELRKVETLIELSFAQPVLVGMIHTDMRVISTWHLVERGSDTLRRARLPAGSWYVGLFQGRLALIAPDFGDVFFVTNREAPRALFNVRSVRRSPREEGAATPAARLRYQEGTVDLRFRIESQIYADERTTWMVVATVPLTVFPEDVRVVKNWERGVRSKRRE